MRIPFYSHSTWRRSTKQKSESVQRAGRRIPSDSAKKRAKTRRNAGKINIWEEIDRWKTVKEDNSLQSNAEVARFLIDQYYAVQPVSVSPSTVNAVSAPMMSTPGPNKETLQKISAPEVSEISMDSDCSIKVGSTTLTGMSAIEDSGSDSTDGYSGVPKMKEEKRKSVKKMSESFIYPFEENKLRSETLT
ncbi:uncharacterized protein [Ptychodera flava]|uniref:uncharacterized protein isoform X1 n=1 Tax=Ptychodera flava TaxID=63121 RepID=UPI003969BEED